MDNLSIATPGVTLTIDGDENRVIRFHPTDVEFAENYLALVAEFQRKQAEIEQRTREVLTSSCSDLQKRMNVTQLTREAYNVMRAGIDRTFGEGTSQTVFGDRNSLELYARFFHGVTPYIARARQAEIERYTKAESESGVME